MPDAEVHLPYTIRIREKRDKNGDLVPQEVKVPDMHRFLEQEMPVIQTLLREPLNVTSDAFRSMFVQGGGKFFFVDRKTFTRPHQANERAEIYNGFHAVFQPVELPPKECIRDFGSIELDLFNILRLNLCLASKRLNGSNAENVLKDLGLRGGLPTASVVPSVRSHTFARFKEKVTPEKGGLVQHRTLAEALDMPYDKDRKTTFVGHLLDRNARFTITRETADRVIAALRKLYPAFKPGVDDVFPVQNELNGRGLDGWKTLAPQSGNII